MATIIEENKNSMLYWFPKVEKVVPVPRTVMVKLAAPKHVFDFFGETEPARRRADKFAKRIAETAREFGYPLFLRTDLTACKHDWIHTCYVENEEAIPRHLGYMADTCLSLDLFFQAFVVREFLHLESTFNSHDGMPVAKEFRFFGRDGEYICHHPYWAMGAIQNPTSKDWMEEIKSLRVVTGAELDILKKYTSAVTKILGGYWSVDFCKTREGKWFMTDMALGEESYHWTSCEHSTDAMRAHYGDDPDAIDAGDERELGILSLFRSEKSDQGIGIF